MRGGEYSQKSVSYPALENDAVCDCLVVGGGLCGVLTSYLLSEAGLSVILGRNNARQERQKYGKGNGSSAVSLLEPVRAFVSPKSSRGICGNA